MQLPALWVASLSHPTSYFLLPGAGRMVVCLRLRPRVNKITPVTLALVD